MEIHEKMAKILEQKSNKCQKITIFFEKIWKFLDFFWIFSDFFGKFGNFLDHLGLMVINESNIMKINCPFSIVRPYYVPLILLSEISLGGIYF